MPRTWRAVIVQTLMDWGADLEALKQRMTLNESAVDRLNEKVSTLEKRCADLERDRLRCAVCGECDGACQK